MAGNKKNPVETDFDIKFQMSILKLALTEDFFCQQLVKYLGNEDDLKKYSIFDSDHLQIVFRIISEGFKQYGERPSEGQIRQKFKEYHDQVEELNETLSQIQSTDAHDHQYFRDNLAAYIKSVKLVTSMVKIKNVFKDHPHEAPQQLQVFLDDIFRVSLDKDSIVTMENLPNLISDSIGDSTRKIPTGVKEWDAVMLGGLPRQNLVIVLAGTNVGKSLFAISLGCNALRARDENGKDMMLKVLHYNLEGQHDEAIKRYAANLAGIDMKDIETGRFDSNGRDKLEETIRTYTSKRLMIKNKTDFGFTIEELIADCREIYKQFPFDMLVVDYGQLLTSKIKADYRLIQSHVFKGLDSLSKEFDCVVVSPAQATRGGIESQSSSGGWKRKEENARLPVLQSHHISESIDIARVAGVIVSLNVTEDESNQNRLRLFLEKQRKGKKGLTFGLITQYARANLITGKSYNPNVPLLEPDAHVPTAKKEFKSLDNIPKPAHIKTEVVDELSEMEATIETEANAFEKGKKEMLEVISDYNAIRDSDTLSEEDEEKLDALVARSILLKDGLIAKKKEIRTMMPQAYPDLNLGEIENLKEKLKKLIAEKGDAGEISKLKRIIRHGEIAFDINKVPDEL